MAITIQLKSFTVKASPVAADIIYLGDSANSFDEVQSTIAEIIGAYPALSSIAALTTAANQMIYTTASNTYAVAAITAFGRSIVALTQGVIIPASGSFATWDTNKNLSANSFIAGYATTVTSATPIVLTVASAQQQYLTGSTAQTVTMPVTSTLAAVASGTAQTYLIVNNSSATATINSSGNNLIESLPAGSQGLLTCISNTGTTATSWSSDFILNIAGVSSIAGTANQVIASGSTGPVTLSLPQSIAATSTPTFAGLVLTNPYVAGAGGLHSFQILTSGTGATYTKPANVTSILVETLGPGGGGGGSTGSVSNLSAAGGGGSGGYARLFVPSAAATYTYTVGTGGAGGTAGGGTGASGGTTTFSASSLQATGGAGGVGGISSATAVVSAGGAAGVGSNGNINCSGAPGTLGVSAGVAASGGFGGGSGGSSIYGGGGVGVGAQQTGAAGGNYGSGGAGAVSATTNQVGGAGSNGLIVVWEFA